MLTTFQADAQVVAALRAGASGFLVKDTPPAEIISAVRLVAAGDAIVSPSVTRTLLSHFGNTEAAQRHRNAAERLAALTDREREVAAAVGAGASNAEIAAVAVHERGHGQGARVAAAEQAGRGQPGSGRHRRA